MRQNEEPKNQQHSILSKENPSQLTRPLLSTYILFAIIFMFIAGLICFLFSKKKLETQLIQETNEKHLIDLTNPTKSPITTPTEKSNYSSKKFLAKELFKNATTELSKLSSGDIPIFDERDESGAFIGKTKNVGSLLYHSTGEPYQYLVNKYAHIFTGEALEQLLAKKYFLNVDGELYILIFGYSGSSISITGIEEVNVTDNKYTFLVKYDDLTREGKLAGNETTTQFTFEKIDNEYLVSNIDSRFFRNKVD